MTRQKSTDPKKLVSIIVPFHNRQKEMYQLINTLPDRADLEVILVDDQSSTILEINRRFFHSRIVHKATCPDKRFAGSARNIGLDAAQGDWIFFCDSDDLLITKSFNEVMNLLPKQGVDIIHTLSESFFDDGSSGPRSRVFNQLVQDFHSTGHDEPLVRFHPPWSKFIKRDFIKKTGARFDNTKVANDVMFNARLSIERPIRLALLHKTYRVRQGNISLTSSASYQDISQRLTVMREYNTLLKENNLDRLRTPAFSHIRKIALKHPIRALLEIFRTIKLGDPIFATAFTIMIKYRIFKATQSSYP